MSDALARELDSRELLDIAHGELDEVRRLDDARAAAERVPDRHLGSEIADEDLAVGHYVLEQIQRKKVKVRQVTEI